MAKATANRSRARASQDLDAIETLQRTPAFVDYFARRVTDPVRESSKKILYDVTLSKDEVWEEVLRFRALFGVSKLLISDEAVCRRMIENEPALDSRSGEDV